MTAPDLEGLRALLDEVRQHLAQAVDQGWYEETATPLHEAMIGKIDAALRSAAQPAAERREVCSSCCGAGAIKRAIGYAGYLVTCDACGGSGEAPPAAAAERAPHGEDGGR
jgi:hypothetical protein